MFYLENIRYIKKKKTNGNPPERFMLSYFGFENLYINSRFYNMAGNIFLMVLESTNNFKAFSFLCIF